MPSVYARVMGADDVTADADDSPKIVIITHFVYFLLILFSLINLFVLKVYIYKTIFLNLN